MRRVRQPAVAGLFYPGEEGTLRETVRRHLDRVPDPVGPPPKALIAPHAGYVYSGPVAATGYRRLESARDRVQRVVLFGPAHRHGFRGMATHSADAFATPLGEIPLDPAVRDLPGVQVLDRAHEDEHSLEVHLPFLQEVLGDFALLPVVVGQTEPAPVAAALATAWGGDETVVVVSSDLSHYHGYDDARRMDAATAADIVALRPGRVGPEQACGCRAVGGLLALAAARGLTVDLLDLRNSGDTAGPRDRVVGYGTFTISEGATTGV